MSSQAEDERKKMSVTTLHDTADRMVLARLERAFGLDGPKWSRRRTVIFVAGASALLWGLIGLAGWGLWRLF